MGKKAAFLGDDERTRALIAAGGKGELTWEGKVAAAEK